MKKRIIPLLLALMALLFLAACGGDEPGGAQTDTPGSGGIQAVDPDAPAHERLLAQAENHLVAARQQNDVGLTLQGEYFYGQAQASVSALRYAVDTILWLMGEGESLADVTAGAPYRDWNAIVAAGMGSPAPHYFEGLVLEIQGKKPEAQVCYDRAAANPNYEEADFWYLRNMTVEELYALREEVLAVEVAIYEEYTPRTALCSVERTGAEYSPTYHLTLAAQAAADGHDQLAWECALNALLTNPTQPELYAAAVSYGLNAGSEDAVSILNEGLFVFPEDGKLNYLAGAAAISAGDKTAAQEFLAKAASSGDGELAAMSQELLAQAAGS